MTANYRNLNRILKHEIMCIEYRKAEKKGT